MKRLLLFTTMLLIAGLCSAQMYIGTGGGASTEKKMLYEFQSGYILDGHTAFQFGYITNANLGNHSLIGKLGLYNPFGFVDPCEVDKRFYIQPMIGLGQFSRELNKEIVTELGPVISLELGKRISKFMALYSNVSYNDGPFAIIIGLKTFITK